MRTPTRTALVPLLALVLLPLVAGRARAQAPEPAEPALGAWRAVLECPGGELPFGLELERAGDELVAFLVNGPERIRVPRVEREQGTFVFHVDHYAARIVTRLAPDGRLLQGAWTKRTASLTGGATVTSLPFRAVAGEAPRFSAEAPPAGSVDGRWSARFSSSEHPAVGVFRQAADGTVTGTFLTTTGDYRYLAGRLAGDRLRLSCFDGAHAFLFDARLGADGTLAGDFWSRDAWHETWTAERDEDAELSDPWARTSTRDDPALALHAYPEVDAILAGRPDAPPVSLADPRFLGKVLVIEVFGSWCPNCHDLGRTLATLAAEVDPDEVAFVGLAFELSGDAMTDAEQVRRYAERHGLEFTMLLAGTADKQRAAEAVPGLTRVEAFPTTIFVGRDGRVRRVHSGFAGPGTGKEHERLVSEYRATLVELAAEPAPVDATELEALLRGPWRDPIEESFTTFEARGEASGTYVAEAIFSFFAPPPDGPLHTGSWLLGPTALHQWPTRSDDSPDPDAVPRFAASPRTVWHRDARAGVYLDGRDLGRRLIPGARPIIPVVGLTGPDQLEDIRAKLDDEDPLWRREAVYAMARIVLEARKPNPFIGEGEEPPPVPEFDPTPLLADEDPWVRCTAAWAAGVCAVEASRAALTAALDHGHAALRREAARALGRLPETPEARAELEALARDLDPLVRAAAAGAVAAFDAPPPDPSEGGPGGPPPGWQDGDQDSGGQDSGG